mgnify:CR=1 FL=1
MVEITGLKAGEKYCFRVGDAEKGWWSDAGVIETADRSNQLTFFHMSDSQSQSERQYSRSWAKVLDTAYKNVSGCGFHHATRETMWIRATTQTNGSGSSTRALTA